MAQVFGQYSARIIDADGNIKSYPINVVFDDATATLASIAAAMSSLTGKVDAVTDGKVIEHSLTLNYTLPGGLKTDPVAGSNVQETGLLTFLTTSPAGRSHATDIPAFHQAGFTAGVVNAGQAGNAALIADAISQAGTFKWMDAVYGYFMSSFKSGRKSFRK